MKKWLLGSLVGGILIFIWQTLSWTVLNLHVNGNRYTPNQDTILTFLGSQIQDEGDYFLPSAPADASSEERNKLMESSAGKPWAKISYHKAYDASMTGNILRGLLVDIIMVFMLVWILMKVNQPTFNTILLSCVFVGLISFITFPYALHIWFKLGDVMASLADGVVSWGLCGIWLGWWLRRGNQKS